jgi:hypothetical protein
VASIKVIAALKQEGLCQKARAEDLIDTTTVSSAKAKPHSSLANCKANPKRCTFCNMDGHDLNMSTCYYDRANLTKVT